MNCTQVYGEEKMTIMDITDLLEHLRDLTKDARPIRGKTTKYTTNKRNFANKIFPAIENAGIIT